MLMLHSVVGIHCATRYTGVITGHFMLGLVSWVLLTRVSFGQHEQGVTNQRVEPLLSFKHLFQQYIIIGTAYKNTSDLRYHTQL